MLSFLHSSSSEGVLSVSLLSFIFLLSVIGLLISLRLKSELEDYLTKIDSMVHDSGLAAYSTHDETVGHTIQPLKFRWIFTLFYLITTMGSLALVIQQFVGGF